MKKIWKLLSVIVVALALGACTSDGESASDGGDAADKKPAVTVSTSFLRDMVEQLAGDQVTVETIIPAGEDPHGYLARPRDLKKIQGRSEEHTSELQSRFDLVCRLLLA